MFLDFRLDCTDGINQPQSRANISAFVTIHRKPGRYVSLTGLGLVNARNKQPYTEHKAHCTVHSNLR